MLDFEAQQAVDGKLPCIVPDVGNDWGTRFLDGPAWESAYLIIPWYIYEYRGDRRILERHYENYKRWIAWYLDESRVIDKKRFGAENGGGSKDSKYKNPQNVNQGNVIYYGIGDWPPNGQTPFEITSTAYYYNAAKIIAATAHLLGNSAEEIEYSDLATNMPSTGRFMMKPQGPIPKAPTPGGPARFTLDSLKTKTVKWWRTILPNACAERIIP